ncbi:MAG: NAD(P)-dependent alcohol dehydrogenase [bacterium]|nr:NAD(P)-dependent alcohol dehydrogenase [bacterium]
MKAVVYEKFGPPNVLHMAEVPQPEPAAGEVKIRMHATSVNPTDVMFRSGALKGRPFAGWWRPKHTILGSDVAGEVDEVGPGVDEFSPGDRIVGIMPDMEGGAYAEFACIEASSAVRIPDNITYAEAAAFAFAGLSSLFFLSRIRALEPGKQVLIVGASGGLGTFAVQLAHNAGAVVTAVCSEENVALVKSLGADDVIDYTHEDPTKRRDAYDVVFDAVAAGSFGRYRRTLRRGGIYSTTVMKPRALMAMALNPFRPSRRRAHTMIASGDAHQALSHLRDLCERGELHSIIEVELPFQLAAMGHRRYETGHTTGKIVLTA